MIVPFIKEAKTLYSSIVSCSMDKDYHSPRNRKALDGLLELNVLPKKGKKSMADRGGDLRWSSLPHAGNIQGLSRRSTILITADWIGYRHMARKGRSDGRTGGRAVNMHRLGQIVEKQKKQHDQWHKARRKAA